MIAGRGRWLAAALIVWCAFIGGCARGPFPAGGGDGGTGQFLNFVLTVNDQGLIDTHGNGRYRFLFNAANQSIDATQDTTYTDYVEFDGQNFIWWHRQNNVPGPGFTFIAAGNVNPNGSISANGKSLILKFNVNDASSLFSQYLQSNNFTCHAITLDSSSRPLDTLGPGFAGNIQFTDNVNKVQGAVAPFPSGYPADAAGDNATRDDLPADFPYKNFDITVFQINTG